MVSNVLPAFPINAGELLQHVSRVWYRDKPLHYGRTGTNRYDAPDRNYGVLYLGLDLPTALMESVFHKHEWHRDTNRAIALSEARTRLVRAVGVLKDLNLADLTAQGVMAGYFGLNLQQLAGRDYAHTQKVSHHVHGALGPENKPRFDGVFYPSRNNYPGGAIALFERAKDKVKVFRDFDLRDHVYWPKFVAEYRIGVEPDPGPIVETEEEE